MKNKEKFNTYQDFWPYYMSEHSDRRNRNCHYVGSVLVLICLMGFVISGNGYFVLAMPFVGYGFAWFGHFYFEKNKPATFKHPWWSLISDYRMFFNFIVRK